MIEFVSEHDALLNECDWIAVDKNGLLGIFSTGGFGPLPKVLADKISVLDNIYEDVQAMPKISESLQEKEVKQNIFSWICCSERGLYGYDWCNKNKAYKLLTSPSKPLLIEDINQTEQEKLAVFKLNVCFKESKLIHFKES